MRDLWHIFDRVGQASNNHNHTIKQHARRGGFSSTHKTKVPQLTSQVPPYVTYPVFRSGLHAGADASMSPAEWYPIHLGLVSQQPPAITKNGPHLSTAGGHWIHVTWQAMGRGIACAEAGVGIELLFWSRLGPALGSHAPKTKFRRIF